jgi:integrase
MTVELPPPRTEGGKPLMQALKLRRSIREYADRPVPLQLLSDLLWAAFGINRPASGDRTAPYWRHIMVIDSSNLYPAGTKKLSGQTHGQGGQAGLQGAPAMLRHACGYALANKGHDTRSLQAYLGHRNIQHTVRYTELSPTRFKDFSQD